MNQNLDTLNQQFALGNSLHFCDGTAGLAVAEIACRHSMARVALQGAQVLAWQPVGHGPVIWVSKAAVFEPGKGVRGGVPVCWPWFGARDGLPAHGFVRTRTWQVRHSAVEADGQVVLVLGIQDDASTRTLWDFAFDLELVVTVGQQLSMALTTRNTGHQAFSLTEALHTYFAVTDIDQTRVQGLAECHYLDKVNNFARTRQTGAVVFKGETDRIYTDTQADCLIQDQAGQRVIRVGKTGSASTVVWNPWSEREKAFADMASGEYQQMLCVETGNAGPDQIILEASASHTLNAIISIA